MRILLINQTYHPDVAATAQHAHDLARHLVAHGHEVEVIASRSLYGHAGAALPTHEIVDGIEIHRVGKSLFGKRGIAARAADFALFYVAALSKSLQVRRADVVVCLTTPPFISLVGILLRALRGGRYVQWLMDLYPDVAVVCGVLGERSLATRFFDSINRFTLRQADRVVVLGRCMEARVLEKGIGAGGAPAESDRPRVVHIGVWSDEAEVRPIPRAENPYRREWSLGDSFVAMYSGNFGVGHDVDTMLGAAERLREDARIRFAFVGGGKRKPTVDAFVATHGLLNVVVAGYQPRERLDASLSSADVHLVSLREGLEGCLVPCKLFGAMAAARPTVFIGHPSSEIARVLVEHDCGVVIRPGDVDGLAQTLRSLASDGARAEQMGRNARQALAAAYSRHAACEAWRLLLEGSVVEEAEARAPEAPRP